MLHKTKFAIPGEFALPKLQGSANGKGMEIKNACLDQKRLIIELAKNYHYNRKQLKEIESLVEAHYDELISTWKQHFSG